MKKNKNIISGTKSTNLKLSLVMSTYVNDNSVWLKDALQSIAIQTKLPDEIVIVCDGPISIDSENIIREFVEKKIRPTIVLKLPYNLGRGAARNRGVEAASHELIGIMDSDDIMKPDRIKDQSIILMGNKEVDLVCALVEEFEGDPSNIVSIKYCAEYNEQIVKDLKFSCCISNPTIIFRKYAWTECGGFPNFREANEDYLFFLRLSSYGKKFYCVQKPLLMVRISEGQKQRRRGFVPFMDDVRFRIKTVQEGHQNILQAIFVLLLIAVRRFAPAFIGDYMQKTWRRVRSNNIKK